ncbi:MAG: hypothetical protein KC931_09095, partial [Candidatus Omnitrophica bacterium]|nr:hypothetical protein [Candidatus Omnitrophota bacterium]
TAVLDSVHVILQDKTVKEILETLEKLYPIRFEFKDNHSFTAYPKLAATAEPARRGNKKGFDTVVETLKVNGDSLWQLLELLATYSNTGLSIHPEVDRNIKVHVEQDGLTVREIFQILEESYPIRFEYTDESTVLVLPSDEPQKDGADSSSNSSVFSSRKERSKSDSHPRFDIVVEHLNVQGDNLREVLELLAAYSETEITVDPEIPQANLILEEKGKTVREILEVIEGQLPIQVDYIDETHAVVHLKEEESGGDNQEETHPSGEAEAQIEVEIRIIETGADEEEGESINEILREFPEAGSLNPSGLMKAIPRNRIDEIFSKVGRSVGILVISAPKIRVINGETGHINVASPIPIVKDSSDPQTGDPDIGYVDLGVSVEVLPTLLDSGKIDLALDIEHKTVDKVFQQTDSDGNLLPGPPINTQRKSLKVRTENGETILIKPLWQGESEDPNKPTEVWGLVTARTVGEE